MHRTERHLALVLFVALAGLLARALGCWVLVPAWETRANVAPAPDAFPQLALSLLETGTLGFGPLGANPTTTRGPGFALWLALGVLLGGNDVRWLAFWGSLPGLAAGCAIVWLLLRRYGAIAAVAGALVSVLHPLPVFVAGRVLGDDYHGSLGMMGLVTFFAAGAAASRRRGWMLTLTAGLLFAVHVLTRSTGLLTLLALAVVTAVMDHGARRRLVAVLAIALVPAVAWSIRSSRLEGRPVLIQSLVAYNFWLGEGFDRFSGEELRGESRRLCMGLVFDKAGLDESRLPGFWWIQLTPAEAGRIEPRLAKAARERIVQDPLGYAGRVWRGLGRYWFAGESVATSRTYFLTVLPVVLIALWGAARILSGRIPSDSLAWAALATTVLTALAYAAIIPMARYSVQVYPELAYVAGIGAVGFMVSWRKPRSS